MFNRHHDGVELTQIRPQLLERVRAGVNQIGSARHVARLMASELCALEVGFFVPLAMAFRPELFDRVRLDRPRRRIEFVEAGSDNIIAAIGRGRLGIGFVTETGAFRGFAFCRYRA